MTDSNELLDLAKMGMDAEVFMRSPLGKFLTKKAEREKATALDSLVDTDPADVKGNTEFRNQIHVVNMFLTWVREAVMVGKSATDQLREEEDQGNLQ
jgi:hypothetical protein